MGEKGRMTMIRYRWKYGDLRGETWKGGRVVMPKGERAEHRKKRERGRRCGERGSAAARLIAVDLHDKRSRQLVTKVALRH